MDRRIKFDDDSECLSQHALTTNFVIVELDSTIHAPLPAREQACESRRIEQNAH